MTVDGLFKPDCRLWSGDRPCDVQRATGRSNCSGCGAYVASPQVRGSWTSRPYDPAVLLSARRICIVEAGGMGSVLRTTAVSRAIRAANPGAAISWVSHARGVELLSLVPGVVPIDSDFDVLTRRVADRADLVVNFDCGTLGRQITTRARVVAGFRLDHHDHFAPAAHAEQLQRLQIDDRFRKSSTIPLQAVLVGVLGLARPVVGYDIALTPGIAAAGRATVAANFGGRRPRTVFGLNVGSSGRGVLKRWSPRRWAELATRLVRSAPDRGVLLLSGPEDRAARKATVDALTDFAMSTDEYARIQAVPGHQSVTDFLGVVAAMDLVVTADSFGLHAAAALRVPVVAVVGPMPHRELELGPRERVIGPALHRCRCPSELVLLLQQREARRSAGGGIPTGGVGNAGAGGSV